MAGLRLSDLTEITAASLASDDIFLVRDISAAAGAGASRKITVAELTLATIPNGDKGDITTSAGGATWTIDNDVVTYAKMQNISAQYSLLGRSSSGAGDVQEIPTSADTFTLLGSANFSAMRTALSLVPGTDIQVYSANLAAIAALAVTDNNIIVGNGTTWVAESGATARASLGLTIGTDVQAYDADTAAIAALTHSAGNVIVSNGTTWLSEPLDTYNAIINGDFDIWQRGTSFVSIADGAYTADRFIYAKNGAMVHDISRSTDVPSVAGAGRLFNYSMLVDCQTADTSIAAGEYAYFGQKIEGFNWLPLAQRVLTLCFWVKATKTGVYCVSLRNSGGDRSFVGEYTVNVSDTWEFKTVSVSASPSAGTWDYTTGAGLFAVFTLATGSTYQTSAGSWASGLYLGSANQVNACDSTSNNFRITGVRLVAGSVAKPLVQRPYAQELELCQRYLTTITGPLAGVGHKWGTTYIDTALDLPTPMRAAPTATTTSVSWATTGPGANEISFFNKETNAYATISGALTFTATGSTTRHTILRAQAGTSFSGTDGQHGDFYMGGSNVVVYLSAEL